MSQLIASGTGGVATTSSSTFSSSSSSSFSASSSSSSSKVVKSSTSSKSVTSSSKTSSVSVKSSGKSYSDKLALDMGIDVSKEMDRLKLCLNDEMSNIHRDMFRLMPTTPPPPNLSLTAPSLTTSNLSGSGISATELNDALVRLDADSVRSCIDKNHSDRLKLNFDVTEYESESISVKTVGNKIEVHAQKKSKKGDEERSEEFSRVYELPTSNNVDPSHVTSSIYQDGVLTIELPVAEALDAL